MTTTSTYDVAAIHRRTVRTLVTAQALGGIGITIGVATASLLARDVSGSESQAGLAQTTQVLGAAVASFLLARLMARRGRRVGQVTGLLLGASGAGLAVVAGVVESMPLLLLGTAMLGCSSAANLAARYAATDLAPVRTRARSLAFVVWATTVGAVVGPNLTGAASALARKVGTPELTGPFMIAAIGMLVAAFVIAVWLRPDPLLVARAVADAKPSEVASTSWRRARQALAGSRPLVAAIVGLASAHAVMVSVMIMTPLHMEHGGAELSVMLLDGLVAGGAFLLITSVLVYSELLNTSEREGTWAQVFALVFPVLDVVLATVAVLGMVGFAAGLLPARRAANLNVVDCLRS